MSPDSNLYCTFYLVRHGLTDMNALGLLQGQSNSALTDIGKEQAKHLAHKFHNIHFDSIFSSDLQRAKNTAEIIAVNHNLAVETSQLLRERSWGKLEGQKRDVLFEFEEVYKSLTDEEKFTYKGHEDIESDEELTTRFITFIREVAIENPRKKILLVSHENVIVAFLVRIGFWSYGNALPLIPHTSYIKFLSDGVDFYVEDIKGFDTIIPRELRISDR